MSERFTPAPVSPHVREITVDADGIPLSGLLSEPSHTPPRAVVVALHGGGMRAGYFHGRAHPSLSLLTLGATLGFTVLALDRPGYGTSATLLPAGRTLAEQSLTLHTALDSFARQNHVGAGFFLVAHSYGGKLALTAAADGLGDRFLGLDISGCGHQYAVGTQDLPRLHSLATRRLSWGPLHLYPPNTFAASRCILSPMPEREWSEAAAWPSHFPEVARRVRVPVRLTFAEHEAWWRHDDEALATMTDLLSKARVIVDRQPHAGHNISLGWAARPYHLRALVFLEECLCIAETTQKRPGESAGPATDHGSDGWSHET
ncbi:alpha/beta hydrolase [Streptomyces coacervatus]|uniref:Alpha/beta hydrolase n=1 Tax=Streptomyces coacervatus TaxID=647381 RepID=A0ABP7J6R2_9ACTN|nr:alpha/beta fold hydrolase [Streptomyces coacervatus]MDF2273500.1 alpha/beta fold hydrolase [Streptomyces coacervatus]